MTKFLFAAEADRIQLTLFRTARQRQVVGGSRLIAEFGLQARKLAQQYGADPDHDVLIAAGGSFRVLFPSAEQATDFGQALADAYRLLLDGSITAVRLVPVADDFRLVNRQVHQAIRKSKRSARKASDTSHVPSTAFCQSSGVGLAVTFDEPVPRQGLQYLSAFAQKMGQTGDIRGEEQGKRYEAPDRSFLGRIGQCLPQELQTWRWADVDDVAKLDGERANVAYVVADGNGMGQLFGECDEAQIKALSDALDNAIKRAVAQPVTALITMLRTKDRLPEILPLLPLILAGDDVFVLLPAKYALDFARRFCLEFERAMGSDSTVQALRAEYNIPAPTISAAVVICKGNYPYHLAHARGEELLKQAKQMVKAVGLGSNEWHSALAFDMIVGSELITGRESTGEYQPSLAPYWVTEQTLNTAARQASIPIDVLLSQRRQLNMLPAKRLIEARELYAPETLPANDADLGQRWHILLSRLRDRILTSDPHQLVAFDQALQDLGDSFRSSAANPGQWKRATRGERAFHGHGLPDLIAIWDYAQSLDYPLEDYEEEL
jgi:hypothetical protein